MSDQEQAGLRMTIAALELEHEDYAQAIDAMVNAGINNLVVQRFKKKKLRIKDRITALKGNLIPDIIA